MKTKKNAPRSLLEAQPVANKFVMGYIENNPLGLGRLGGDDFKTAMDAVVRAMMAAWADGFCVARGDA